MTSPYRLYSVEQIRAIEASALRTLEGTTLMQRAGQAAFDAIRHHFPDCSRLNVFCGGGNNGGDGYIVARLAKLAGLAVRVFYLGELASLSDEAAKAHQAAHDAGVLIAPWHKTASVPPGLLVDALLGIGLSGEVRAPYRELIAWMNQTARDIVSLDIPSGVCADSGAILGQAIHARLTVSFIGLKAGMVTGDAVENCGKVVVDDLGLSALLASSNVFAYRQNRQVLAELLLPRKKNAHKGDFGHVLVVGGEHGFGGAVCLAAEAALLCGAGKVSVATRKAHVSAVITRRPEVMCLGVTEALALAPLLAAASVCIVGPGLGQGAWGKALLAAVLKSQCKKIIDADALNLLALSPTKVSDAIITPHPGEAARLLNQSISAINNSRYSAAKALHQLTAAVVVLKGAGTIVKTPSTMSVCSLGNPGMATPGMGDLLAGVIAALVAQGCSLQRAAEAGVFLHALSADKVLTTWGECGLSASHLLDVLPRELARCHQGAGSDTDDA